MTAVLFVCRANICRSPMAEALFRAKAKQDERFAGWSAESAGTWVDNLAGSPASTRAQMALFEQGLDVSDHQARNVGRDMLEAATLVFTMESGQKEALRAEFPDLADKIFVISELVNARYDIADPMGGSLVDFKDTVQEFEYIFSKGSEHMLELAARLERRPEDNNEVH